MPETTTDLPSFPVPRERPFEPPSAYAQWRESGPLTKVRLPNGSAAWAVTRYADVREVLSTAGASADKMRPGFPHLRSGVIALSTDSNLEFMDEPDHGKYRRMLSPMFTARRVDTMRPAIQQIVDGALDRMLESGPPADLHGSLSLPVPSLVICQLLGVPYTDHDFFQSLTVRMLDTTTTRDEFASSLQRLHEYLLAMVKEKAGNPTDDVVGMLLDGPARAGEVTHEQIAGFAMLLLVAGHETTANQISMGTLSLLREPAKHEAIRRNLELLPGAIEEMLRVSAITDLVMLRLATEDIDIGGCPVKAGEAIVPLGAAANHDPQAYSDPGEFEPSRGSRSHLTFGFGMHSCLGQNLARAELEIVFRTLFARVPTLRLDADIDDLPFKKDGVVFGVHELPVAW